MSLLSKIELHVWWVCGLAVGLNAMAQISLQRAHVHSLGQLSVWLQPWVLLAVGAYGLSFGLSAWLYSRVPLSKLSPLMAGLIFLILLAYDAWVLQRPVSWHQLMGVLLIGAGIFLIVRVDA
jgi:small multidrug resistance pump